MSHQNTLHNINRPYFQNSTLPDHNINLNYVNRYPLPNNNQNNPSYTCIPDQRPPSVDYRFAFPTHQRPPFVDNRLPPPADQRPRFDVRLPFPTDIRSSWPGKRLPFPTGQGPPFNNDRFPSSNNERPPFINRFQFPDALRPPLGGSTQHLPQVNRFGPEDCSVPGNIKTPGLSWNKNNSSQQTGIRTPLLTNPSAAGKRKFDDANVFQTENFQPPSNHKLRLPVATPLHQNTNNVNTAIFHRILNTNNKREEHAFIPPLMANFHPQLADNNTRLVPPPVNSSHIPGKSPLADNMLVQRVPSPMNMLPPHAPPQPINVAGLTFPPPNFMSGPQVNTMNNQNMLPPVSLCPPPPLPSVSDCGVYNKDSGDVYKDLKNEYKETMIDIIHKWIKSRNSIEILKLGGDRSLKLHKFKEELALFVGLVEQLRQLNDSLAENMEAEKCVWDTLIQHVHKTKGKVVTLQSKLFSAEQLDFITREQKNRKRKRDRIRRKKKVQSEQYISSLSARIKLNEEIDETMQKQHTQMAMEKMVESLKNEAGDSLVEVKRKQREVCENTSVLHLLQELRNIRKETAIYKGIFVTEKDDDKFSRQLGKALDLLSRQSEVCESEERALRVLREEEAEEMNRVEKEKRKKRKQNREDQLSTVDPMFPFRLYWLQGEESIGGLIHVRRMWDICHCQPDTRGGTRIPKTFVEPNPNPNREWSKFLIKQPKVRKRKSDIGLSK